MRVLSDTKPFCSARSLDVSPRAVPFGAMGEVWRLWLFWLRTGERGGRQRARFEYVKMVPPGVLGFTAYTRANSKPDQLVQENCVRCCHAWLMRRLGYRIQAGSTQYRGKPTKGKTPAQQSTDYWRNSSNEKPVWNASPGAATDVLVELADTPVGDFGLVRYIYMPSHVLGWEHHREGVFLIDPQLGILFNPLDQDEVFKRGFERGFPGTFQWVSMRGYYPTYDVVAVVKGDR